MRCLKCGQDVDTAGVANLCSACHAIKMNACSAVEMNVKQFGWECPNCHVIYAPWVSQCLCSMPSKSRTTIHEGVIRKGGVNDQPVTLPPLPPKGQGGSLVQMLPVIGYE